MAGLAAAARARELGADVVVHEKGDRPGGSMYLSSCVVWRYRDFERFREECAGGDPELQRVVWEGLDDALAWLEGLGAPVVTRETGNPLTSGVRFDPMGLTEALARRAGDVRLGRPLTELPDGVPVILATGGFQGDADARPRADHARGAKPRPACEPLEHGGRPSTRARGRSGRQRGPRGVLRAQPCRCARDRARGFRPAGPGVRKARACREPRRRRVRGAHMVGDRRRPVDGAAARGPRPLRRSRRRACGAGPRAHRRRGHRGGPCRRGSGRAPRRRDGGRGGRGDHDDAGRDRRSTRAGAPPTGSGPPVRTRAGSPREAGRARSPRRSSSARSPPRTRCAGA